MTGAVPFYGTHQAGITTPAQDRLAFASFDLTLTTAAELRDLLRTWSDAAALLAQGELLGPESEPPALPPADTGEARGLPASDLTITFGIGPTVFEKDGADRLGLRARRPRALTPLGPLPGEVLDLSRSDGDLCVQACAADPAVAFHALRTMARIGRGAVVLRWTQIGFGRTSSTTSSQVTLRNLMGFKDGTNNLRGDDEAQMKRYVWVGGEEPQRWFRDGTYLVSRRIRMRIEAWDRDALDDQERVIGRFKDSGAPLTGTHEHDVVDLEARHADGTARDRRRRARPARRSVGEPRAPHPAPRLLVRGRGRPDARASSTPGCSSSPSSGTRTSSSRRCSAGSGRPTRSTSTSSTRRAPCSRSHPARRPGDFVGAGCSPSEAPRRRRWRHAPRRPAGRRKGVKRPG